MIVAMKPKPRIGSRAAKKTLERIVAANLSSHELANLSGAVMQELADNAKELFRVFEYPAKEAFPERIQNMYRKRMNDCSFLAEQLSKMYLAKVNEHRHPILVGKASKVLR